MIVYLDTSAALKLAVEEVESGALKRWLDAHHGDALTSAYLLLTELFCAAERRQELDVALLRQILDGIELFDVLRGDFATAATSRWGLRSADAIHLAVALRLGCDVMVTYDDELATAAARAGIEVVSPGVVQEAAGDQRG